MSKAQVKKGKSRAKPYQLATESNTSKRFIWLLGLIAFCWPFIYLHSLVFIVNGRYRAIGNDFIDLYYKYKVYLLDNLANFHFPFWSPAEAAGYPFSLSPFTQSFYPFNIALAFVYKVLGGYAPFDHQIFTVFGVALFSLGLFMWLRLINSNTRAVLFATLVMSVSFKVTEILRFPNAVHTAAWYPWILYALTRIILNKSVRDAAVSGILLWVLLIFFCTGGYPYYIYYSVFLFVPYLAVFAIRPLRERLIGTSPVCWKRAVVTMMLVGLAAAMICGPYLLATKHLLDQTTDRGGRSYNFSTTYAFNSEDTLGCLVYPPAAQAEGWYFFSITALLVILLYFFTIRSKTADPSAQNYLNPSVKIFFALWVAIISYITWQQESYLFNLLWKYMPGFSGLRAWGRLNIVLVPVIAWLLSIAYARFEEIISQTAVSEKLHWKKWAPLSAIIVAYGIVLAIQLYFYQYEIFDEYWILYFRHFFSNHILFISYGAAAFVALLLLLAVSRFKPLETNLGRTVVLIGLVAIAAVEMEHVGTRIWATENQLPQKRISLDVAKLDEISFAYRRIDDYGTISLGPNFSVGTIRNWYFDRYVSFLKKTENEQAARRILLGIENGQKIFFSQTIEYVKIREFLQDSLRYPKTGRLLSYNGDELLWEIDAPFEGYLSFIDNWDNGWKAFVDGKPSQIDLLFGTFKSVHIPAGLHRVRFSYQPGILVWEQN